MIKARDSAFAEWNNRQRKVRAFETRVRLPGKELDSLKRCESTNCDVEVMTCKVADAQGNNTDIVTGSH